MVKSVLLLPAILMWFVSLIPFEVESTCGKIELALLLNVSNNKGPVLREVNALSELEAMRTCLLSTDCVSFEFDKSLNMCRHYSSWYAGGRYGIQSRRCPDVENTCHCTDGLEFCLIIFDNLKLTWDAARQYCQDLGGDLISLDTDEKFYFTKEIAASSKNDIWLGASLVGSDWRWVNGHVLSRTNPFWHSRQPDNFGGNDIYLWTGRMSLGSFAFDDAPSYADQNNNFISCTGERS